MAVEQYDYSNPLMWLDLPGAYFRGALAGKPGQTARGSEIADAEPGSWEELGIEALVDPLNVAGGAIVKGATAVGGAALAGLVPIFGKLAPRAPMDDAYRALNKIIQEELPGHITAKRLLSQDPRTVEGVGIPTDISGKYVPGTNYQDELLNELADLAGTFQMMPGDTEIPTKWLSNVLVSREADPVDLIRSANAHIQEKHGAILSPRHDPRSPSENIPTRLGKEEEFAREDQLKQLKRKRRLEELGPTVRGVDENVEQIRSQDLTPEQLQELQRVTGVPIAEMFATGSGMAAPDEMGIFFDTLRQSLRQSTEDRLLSKSLTPGPHIEQGTGRPILRGEPLEEARESIRSQIEQGWYGEGQGLDILTPEQVSQAIAHRDEHRYATGEVGHRRQEDIGALIFGSGGQVGADAEFTKALRQAAEEKGVEYQIKGTAPKGYGSAADYEHGYPGLTNRVAQERHAAWMKDIGLAEPTIDDLKDYERVRQSTSNRRGDPLLKRIGSAEDARGVMALEDAELSSMLGDKGLRTWMNVRDFDVTILNGSVDTPGSQSLFRAIEAQTQMGQTHHLLINKTPEYIRDYVSRNPNARINFAGNRDLTHIPHGQNTKKFVKSHFQNTGSTKDGIWNDMDRRLGELTSPNTSTTSVVTEHAWGKPGQKITISDSQNTSLHEFEIVNTRNLGVGELSNQASRNRLAKRTGFTPEQVDKLAVGTADARPTWKGSYVENVLRYIGPSEATVFPKSQVKAIADAIIEGRQMAMEGRVAGQLAEGVSASMANPLIPGQAIRPTTDLGPMGMHLDLPFGSGSLDETGEFMARAADTNQPAVFQPGGDKITAEDLASYEWREPVQTRIQELLDAHAGPEGWTGTIEQANELRRLRESLSGPLDIGPTDRIAMHKRAEWYAPVLSDVEMALDPKLTREAQKID